MPAFTPRATASLVILTLAAASIVTMAAPPGEQLDRAFVRAVDNLDDPPRLEVEEHGSSVRLIARDHAGGVAGELRCLLCSTDERVTAARALGARVAGELGGPPPAVLALTGVAGERVQVDGLPLAPAGLEAELEPGPHRVEVQREGGATRAEVVLEPGASLLLDVSDHRRDVSRLPRPTATVLVVGAGLTTAAVGGVFLWLDGNCAGTEVDVTGTCALEHDLAPAGWALVAGGALIETLLLYVLWPRDENAAGEVHR